MSRPGHRNLTISIMPCARKSSGRVPSPTAPLRPPLYVTRMHLPRPRRIPPAPLEPGRRDPNAIDGAIDVVGTVQILHPTR